MFEYHLDFTISGFYFIGNSTGFDRKNIVFFPILRNERKEKDKLTSLSSSTQRHGNIHVAFS